MSLELASRPRPMHRQRVHVGGTENHNGTGAAPRLAAEPQSRWSSASPLWGRTPQHIFVLFPSHVMLNRIKGPGIISGKVLPELRPSLCRHHAGLYEAYEFPFFGAGPCQPCWCRQLAVNTARKQVEEGYALVDHKNAKHPPFLTIDTCPHSKIL